MDAIIQRKAGNGNENVLFFERDRRTIPSICGTNNGNNFLFWGIRLTKPLAIRVARNAWLEFCSLNRTTLLLLDLSNNERPEQHRRPAFVEAALVIHGIIFHNFTDHDGTEEDFSRQSAAIDFSALS